MENFDSRRSGPFWILASPVGEWVAPPENAEIHVGHSRSGSQSLKIQGGEGKTAVLRLSAPLARGGTLTFWAERWTSRPPFKFRVDARPAGGDWAEVFNGDATVKLGGFPSEVKIALPPGTAEIRFRATTAPPPDSGAMLDDLEIVPAA